MYDKNLSYEELLIAIENAPTNIFIKDTECKYRFVSEMCCMVNGGPENSIIGKTDLEIQKDKALGQEYYEDDQKILATGKGSKCVSAISVEESTAYFEIKKNPVIHEGKIIGIIGIIDDVTDRVILEKTLEDMSFRDKLTGLYNRNYMESRKQHYARKGDCQISIIIGDCNSLKKINDTLGHKMGDLLLQRVAKVIEQTIPDDCVAMRVGGDEFLILCPGYTRLATETLISNLQKEFANRSDDTIVLDVALGYHTATDDKLSFEEISRLADKAMYIAKKQMKSK